MMWLAVTADQYELPISWGDTLKELSYLMGIKESALNNIRYKTKMGRPLKKYKIIKVDEEGTANTAKKKGAAT